MTIFVWHAFFELKLPPDEDVKRRQRRDRNKNAAAKCRKKRNELREELEKVGLQLPFSFHYLSTESFRRLNKI